jgi:ATP-dependent Clp protease ATP-binding subunit ClpC
MFERYTEKARRVIFFARYEASQFGSPYIETEQLLLGLLREDKRLVYLVLGSQNSEEAIRKKIAQHTLIREKIPTSVDLPLSNESKRVLACAAEEAETLGHKQIGTEHLLLGMLREKSCFAAQLLRDAGVTLEDARFRITQPPLAVDPGGLGRLRSKPADLGPIRDQVLSFKRFVWLKREWKPLDVLVENETGRVHFDRDRADELQFKLVPAGWTKDWCAICGWELNQEIPEHTVGYTNGREWICPKCHDAFFAPYRKPQT